MYWNIFWRWRGNRVSPGRRNICISPSPPCPGQLRELEEELGCTLLVRGKRGQRTALTPEGRLFRQRAQEILDLASKAEQEVRQSGKGITGDVMIGAGETDSMRVIARLTSASAGRTPESASMW